MVCIIPLCELHSVKDATYTNKQHFLGGDSFLDGIHPLDYSVFHNPIQSSPGLNRKDAKMKHTKGKWTTSVGECGATIHMNNDFNHPLTFSFSYPYAHIDKELNEEGKANANLIASAPAMLHALKEIRRLELPKDESSYEMLFVAVKNLVHKALRNAEGEK